MHRRLICCGKNAHVTLVAAAQAIVLHVRLSADLLEVVLGLVVGVRGLAEGVLQVGMPLVQLFLWHSCILGSQAVLHFSNDALPVASQVTESVVGGVSVTCLCAASC